ncbi:hypothetical protein ACPPVU_08580 [Mucilaginibacter sp. McL0603]|uniref:hypothetical protein n=1 Tax=Mucilaginibacter sp. McL0603 TaxID=3415670 RepID=UPI003CF7F867
MDEIKPYIQGVRITRQDNGTYHLILVTLNDMWADVLLHTLGDKVVLKYTYDGYDITFYLVFELPHIDKMFSVPVNASSETKKWLEWIDEKTVTAVRVAYRDGKGGVVPFGKPVGLS